MSDLNCAVCGAACVESGTACRQCRASPQWQDLVGAAQMAAEQCTILRNHGLLNQVQAERVGEILSLMRLQWSEQAAGGAQPPADSGLRPPSQCRQCGRAAGATQSYCAFCGGPTGARADRLRHMDFALSFITHHIAPEMAPDAAERCTQELGARIAAIEAELKSPAAAQALEHVAKANPSGRRNLAEILLDPQSIRWLLASGGALLAVGLVIWLSSLGVFKSAMVVAGAMGLGTLATLAGGGALIRYTRHSLAGRAMALLGCLVMPLNLWFYNVNHLVTLDGNLWAAAMVCCVLYAAAAFVLEDPMFVYVLLGGITMTGLLVLADLHRLADISAPATLLVTLGLITLHAERAFADDDGPFSRKRFGPACFRSAHALIGLGLLALLGSQLVQWAPRLALQWNETAALSSNRFLAFSLVLAGGYGYLYSSLVARRGEIFGYITAVCLLWAELLGVQIGHLTHHSSVLLSVLALTSLTMNIAVSLLSRRSDNPETLHSGPLAPLGAALAALATAMGLLLYLHATVSGAMNVRPFTVTWSYVGAMMLTAASSRIAASLNARFRERLSIAYHVATAATTFVGVTSVLTLMGLQSRPAHAPVLMVLPILYLLASRFHNDGPARRALPGIASAVTAFLVFGGLIGAGSQWLDPIVGRAADFSLAAFCLEAAVFFALSAANGFGKRNVYFSAAMLCGMFYQLLGFWKLPADSCQIAIAFSGAAALIGLRAAGAENRGSRSTATALLHCAGAMISLPMAAVLLMSLSRLASGRMDLSMLWTPAILSAAALIAALASAGGARRWYFSLTMGQITLCLLTLGQYSNLSVPRKLEMFSVMAGLVLLSVGYGLWYREQDGKSDGTGVCLLVGALMAGLPPALFAIINRFGFEVSFVDELVLVTIAVLMFLTGTMCRLRATTLIGGGLLACHLVTLIVFAGMKAQLAVGAYLAIGGAALFVLGLLLSVYRDRLLAMPHRIKHHQGLFRVLAWR